MYSPRSRQFDKSEHFRSNDIGNELDEEDTMNVIYIIISVLNIYKSNINVKKRISYKQAEKNPREWEKPSGKFRFLLTRISSNEINWQKLWKWLVYVTLKYIYVTLCKKIFLINKSY